MDVHLSNILSHIIESVADEMKQKTEIISTDDGLSRIDSFNSKQDSDMKCEDIFAPDLIPEFQTKGQGQGYVFSDVLDEILGEDRSTEEQGDPEFFTDEEEFAEEEDLEEAYNDKEKQTEEVVVCGADVISLFPNIQTKLAAELCHEAILETEIDFVGIDYVEIAIYIALSYSSDFKVPIKVRHLVPRRAKRGGSRPGITGAEALGRDSTNKSGQWAFRRTEFTSAERRLLLAEAIKIGVTTAFQNHLYQFAGKTYIQRDGAPIGVRLSCAVARLVMNKWDRKFMAVLNTNNIKTETAFRYMDDKRVILRALALGWRWDKGQIRFRSRWEQEDGGLSAVERTSRALHGAMESVFDSLKFEMEHQEMFPENKLPTLDFKMWVEDNKIMYSFYQKEVANKAVINKLSALSENVKVASLTQNLIRRCKNTSELLSMEERLAVIDQFTEQVLACNYSRDQTKKIVSAGLIGYENMKLAANKSGSGIHKGAAEGAVERRRKKLVGKSSWFKSSPKQKARAERPGKRKAEDVGDKPLSPVAVLFVPQTPQGALAKKLTQQEVWLTQLSQEKIKVVERSGCTIRQLLIRSNPWGQGHCGRPEGECPPCDTGDGKQRCQQRSVLYETFCTRCKERADALADADRDTDTGNTGNKAVYSVYTGETSLTARERLVGVKGEGARGGGHLTEYEKGLEKNHMTKHWQSCHKGEEKPKFGVKIIRSFTSCLVRQLWEAVRIRRRLQEQAKGSLRLLNSKSEYSRCSLPRLVVEGTEGVEGDDDKKEAEGELHEKDREIEPPPARSNTNNELDLRKDRSLAKTNGHRKTDIRSHFVKQQNSDRGVT